MGPPPPLKNQNFEKCFLHAREDQKIGPRPNFHESIYVREFTLAIFPSQARRGAPGSTYIHIYIVTT